MTPWSKKACWSRASRVCPPPPRPSAGKVRADWLKKIYPDLKTLFTSGYTDDAREQEGVLEPGVAFLPKPYAPAVHARKVRAMLDNETDTARFRKRGTAIHQPPAGST